MTRSQRMKRIADLAALSKKAASERFSSSLRRADTERDRLAEFRRYREEYTQKLSSGQAINAAAAQELRRFIGQLDRTIAALEAQVSHAERACEADRTDWQRESRRSHAIDGVHARCEREDGRREEQSSQHEVDERAARNGVDS